MAIRLMCQCGQQLMTEESRAGQTVRCPHCQLLLRVPNLTAAPPPAAPPGYVAPGPPPGYVPYGPPAYPAPPPYQPPLLHQPAPASAPVGYEPPPYQPPPLDQHLQAPQPPVFQPPVYEEVDQPILEEEYRDPDEVEKHRLKKQKARTRRRQLQITSLGLTLIWWSIACLLAGIAAYLLFVFINVIAAIASAGQPGGPGANPLVLALLILIFVLFLLQCILYLVGSILCCFIPPRSKARPFIIVSVALIGLAFGLLLTIFLIAIAAIASRNDMMTAVQGALSVVLGILIVLLLIASFVLFMLFLRAVAKFLDESPTAEEVLSILNMWIILTVSYIPLVLGGVFVGLAGPLMLVAALLLIVLTISWMVYWVQQWIRLLNVVGTLRQVIAHEYGV